MLRDEEGSGARGHVCGDTTALLAFRDRVECDGGFTRGFWSIDFDDPTLGQAANTQGDVEADAAGGDDIDFGGLSIAHTHDGAFPKLFFNVDKCSV